MKISWFLCHRKQARNEIKISDLHEFLCFFCILWWKRRTKEHFKKFNLRLNWDGPSFEQVLRFSPKFFSARTADAKRARRLLSWSSKTVTIKCYFLDYSNLEQIIKKILKSYIDLKNLITQCLNLVFKCGFCDSSQFN